MPGAEWRPCAAHPRLHPQAPWPVHGGMLWSSCVLSSATHVHTCNFIQFFCCAVCTDTCDAGWQAQDPNGTAAGDMAMGLWSGKLKHRMATQGGYSTVDLLNLTALIPDRFALYDSGPIELAVSLQHRLTRDRASRHVCAELQRMIGITSVYLGRLSAEGSSQEWTQACEHVFASKAVRRAVLASNFPSPQMQQFFVHDSPSCWCRPAHSQHDCSLA